MNKQHNTENAYAETSQSVFGTYFQKRNTRSVSSQSFRNENSQSRNIDIMNKSQSNFSNTPLVKKNEQQSQGLNNSIGKIDRLNNTNHQWLSYFDEKKQKKKEVKKALNMMNKNAKAQFGTRYMEQWINDTLKECSDLEIPGTLSKPEHKMPLSRYGLDRMTLTNLGIPNDLVNRMYNSLFVFTVGFFELMGDCTKFLENERLIIQSKIWKVYQILLEYACKTDYELITKQMEKGHKQEVDELEIKYKDVITKLEDNETQLKEEMRTLRKYCDDLERDKTDQQSQKEMVMAEFQKNIQKHEEEVQLRLFFESKLNTMHHVNREMNSKYKNMKMKNAEQAIKIMDIENEVQKLKEEIIDLNRKIESQDKTIEILQNQEVVFQEDKMKLEKKLIETDKQLNQHKKQVQDVMQEFDGLHGEKNNLGMKNQTLSDYIHIKQNEHNNAQNYLEEMKKKIDYLEELLEQAKMKAERTGNKLKFYKTQYIGFEVTKRVLEEKEHLTRLKLLEKISQHEELLQKNKKLDEECKMQQIQIQDLKSENNDIFEKARIQNLVRHDLEQKLKVQIDQSAKLMQEVETISGNMKIQRRQINSLEIRLKDTEDERNDLDNQLTVMEQKYESMKEKYDSTNISLRQLAENEKESRDDWKDRYERENSALQYANKQIINLKNEIQDTKNKALKLEREALDMKEERDMFKKLRDQFQTKFNDQYQINEKIERELNTKRKILSDYELAKKLEIQGFKQQINEYQKHGNRYQMIIEDISSDMMRLKGKLIDTLEEKDSVINQNIELQTKLTTMRSSHNEMLKDKSLLQQKWDVLQKERDEMEIKLNSIQDKIQRLETHVEIKDRQVEEATMKYNELHQQHRELSLNYNGSIEELDRLRKIIDITNKIDQEVNAVQEINNMEVQTDMTYEKGKMMMYQQNNNQFERMISYASNKSIGDEDGNIIDAKNNKLKPMFHKSGGMRPFTGFHSDLIVEEDMASQTEGAGNGDLRDSDSKKSGGSRSKSFKGKRPPGTSYKGQRPVINNNNAGSFINGAYNDNSNEGLNTTGNQAMRSIGSVQQQRSTSTADGSSRLKTAKSQFPNQSQVDSQRAGTAATGTGRQIKRFLKNAYSQLE